ncbi:MAG: thiamine-phosphate kinase [gamma proteobacterium symbiont of Bathyaustriella thionipta]|nr:thiamine-phosphate kinase [gamma proteobacterium symbiont of Bathyaustriella thionipta]MCU7950177.1 thiamine-phosphate kinase [gamma proteobacterium symbiont of Bathyaustriella thionipta]MCU7952989.1 thiamine-phosphate kinase [gamma proteobacterium symbiont of Bathyaustriella thionipta]MCU7956719.1 thiamine-phosphate kinase [gamma proteobacterium symbiont of Bathyaustriella thionipta]MCU7966371.1 thiamine-phosphate kinase [gamma proteobacterium symbiont of Bathyaustriella thionipta]
MAGSEFQLIQSYFSEPDQVERSDLILGIGDDCAIVSPKDQSHLAFSIDTLNSGIHFPHNTSADAIAYKSLAVNLSDLAAMGAEPAWFTLSLTLPGDDEWDDAFREQWLNLFSQSLFALAAQHNIQLIGGDTTHGSLSVTIQVCGYLEQGEGLKRSGAQVGDIIVVTGALGAAAVGLDIVLERNSVQYSELSDNDKQQAVQALNYPQPRIKEGLSLQAVAHSALDLSDGLLSDLGHILKASHVGAQLQVEQVPLASALSCLDKQQAWEKALAGGDDYELCFTLAKKDWSRIKLEFPHFVAIGQITAEKGLRLVAANGREYKINAKGYDHFG